GTNSFVEAYYNDSIPGRNVCTGDGNAYGSSGFHLATGLCTDYWATASGCGSLASYFRLNRRHYLLPPGTTPAQASTYANYGNNPITTTQNVALLTSFCSSTNYNVTTSSNPSAGGTTTGAGTYASGASVTVTATSNAGYTFTNWTENGNPVSTNANYTFTISANRNLVANFTQSTTNYNVTTSSNPTAGGTTTGAGTYASGASVTVTATANAGYTFVDWTENGNQVSPNPTYTFTLSNNRDLVANFNLLSDIDENTTKSDFRIYPNPSSGRVTVDATYIGELSVINYLGQELQKVTMSGSPKEILIVESGVYFFVFRDDFGNRNIAKVIINK
ncbi:MAG: InlB B-repeat-containing protein, partial [Bacteroidota bacterium]